MPLPSMNARNQALSTPEPAQPSSPPEAAISHAHTDRSQGVPQPLEGQAQPAARDQGGKERRERLYAAVRSAMSGDGVRPADYRVKALALDSNGSRFLVVMDVPASFAGGAKRLGRLEGLIARAAKKRLQITVTGVYWRMDPHALIAVPVPGADAATTMGKAPSAPPAAAASLASRVVAALLPGWGAPKRRAPARKRGIFSPIKADEVAAFRRAKGAAGGERDADSTY